MDITYWVVETCDCVWRLAGIFACKADCERIVRSMADRGRAARIRTIEPVDVERAGLRAPVPS